MAKKRRDARPSPPDRPPEQSPEPRREPPPEGRASGAARLVRVLSGRGAILALAFAALIILILIYLVRGGGIRPFRGNTSTYNVLLITMDTTRADHIGCYGYRQIRTPILDGLADTGVLFENAYTPSVMTLPSHASILTGLLPVTHGVRNNDGYRLGAGIDTLAKILKTAGYRTSAVVGAFVLDSMFGLDQGFDSYDDSLPESGSHDIFFAERNATEVTDAAQRFLAAARAQRWFLWVHYFDPHSPHRPPAPYRDQYSALRYDGEIAYMDAEIGRLLTTLGETGVRDRTIVVVTADHGEGLRDHGEMSHGVFLYDETARVPLIVQVPGFVEGPKRVSSVVRTIDIAPTVLDLLRLPARPRIQGTSLWPLLGGQTDDLSLAAIGESTVPMLLYGWSPMASIREGKWKLIEAPKPELYDLGADPRERNNLAAMEAGTVESLRGRLSADLRSAGEASAAATPAGTTPEDQARLRSLGYAGGGKGGVRGALAGDPLAILSGSARGLPDPKDRLEALDRINKVYIAFGAGDFPAAISAAREILAGDPDNDNVRQYLADSYRSLRRFNEAMAEYRTLLEKDPANVDVMLNTGWVLMQVGDFGQAKAVFTKALEVVPSHTFAMASLGNIALAEGDPGQAVEWYRKVLMQRPNHMQSIIAMATILEEKGMRREAEVLYKHAVEVDPGNLDALLSLGWIQFGAKEYEDALKTIDAAAKIDPKMPELNFYRGDILLALSRLDEAEAQYREGIAKVPQAPQGYHGLGLLAVERGDQATARAMFERALQLDPAFGASREQLKQLAASRP